MPTPVGVADSYTTSVNVPLTVAAPGVLANDTDAVSAVYVADSATNGTVSLSSSGGFTFTPTPNFVGEASFEYEAVGVLEELSGGVLVNIQVGDCVQWAHLTSGADGQMSVEGQGRGKTVWQCFTDLRNRTAAEVCASAKLPQRGDPLRRFKLEAGTYAITRSYEQDGAEVNKNIVVVLVEAKQEELNPWLWRVTVSYEGKDDPTAELPEVSEQETEYQDYRTEDIYGQLVTNSAADPVEGGMPVDAAIDSLVITRNLPYDSWNTLMKQGYRNTLNLNPFRLGNQVDEFGDPIDMPPGTVRLKRITAHRIVRSKAATVAAARFYWQVTAELILDDRVFRPRGGAAEEAVRHRWVYADVGFNKLVEGAKLPITVAGGLRPTEPQLLNGFGGLLDNPYNTWPAVTGGANGPNTCTGKPDVYTVAAAGSMDTVADGLPGVLDNDAAPGDGDLTAHLVTNVTTDMGTLALDPDGSFTFAPNPGFIGYAWFTYKAREDGNAMTDSAETTVVIFVGAAPVMNVRERYRMKDWSPLAALLENW